MPSRTPTQASPRAGKAGFILPYGSRVTYHENPATWTPKWTSVTSERDLLPYRALMTAIKDLPRPLQAATLRAAAQAVEGRLNSWTPAPAVPPTTLPPPLPRPSTPAFGSLTGYLRGTPVARQAIRTALNPWPQPETSPLLCPPLGANPGLVGTAFDYALRFLVQGLNPHLNPVRGPLAARLAALDLDRDRTLAAVDAAEATLSEVASGVPFALPHARAAVVLASYEVVARTGLFQELAGVVAAEASQDVLNLAQAVPVELFRAERQLLLNPQFRAARRFGGADADLLLDDLLIEVKATKHLRLDGTYLQQLTGYLVLDRLAGTVGSESPIHRLGVYFARHGVMQVIPVRDAYRPEMLPQLVPWFHDRLPHA